MANWPSYNEAYAGTTPTGLTGTIAQTLPPVFSSATGSQGSLTGTAHNTLPKIGQHAVGGPVVPLTGTMHSTLPSIRSGAVGSRPVPVVARASATTPYEALTAEERRIYVEALTMPHRVRARVRVYDGNEVVEDDIRVADGQVDLDATADVTRSCSLTIVDPRLKFAFAPTGTVYLDRQIGIRYGVEVRELGYWVDVPVFQGPVTGWKRQAHEVTIEAQGKESLMLPPVKQYAVPSLVTRREVQQASMSGLSGTGSFRLAIGAQARDDAQEVLKVGGNLSPKHNLTVKIVRGSNYTAAGIRSAIEDAMGHGVVRIDMNPNADTGFKMTFSGRWTGVDVPPVFVVDASSGVSGDITEVVEGIQSIANRHVADYIRRVASQYGEQKFNLGQAGNAQVPKSFDLDPAKAADKGVWPYLQQVADSVNMALIYDGRGFLTLRPHRSHFVTHTFEDDVLSDPSVGLDLSNVRNVVEVYGKDRNGRDVLRWRETLRDSHPLSAKALGRNGVPRVLLEQVKLDNSRITNDRARQIAERTLDQHTLATLDASFDALPIPHLEDGDTVRLTASGFDSDFVLKQFSLPLGPASMSVGFVRARPVAKFKARGRMVRPAPRHKHKAHA